jgi:hypothetical protein
MVNSDWYLEILARSLDYTPWLIRPDHADYLTKMHLYTSYTPPTTITYPKTEISMQDYNAPTPSTARPPWQVNTPTKIDVPGFPQNRITLDPNDPFDAALIPIVETNRRKRKDYAKDGDPFSNFKVTSQGLGMAEFGPTEAALFNVLQKLARLQSLRANGRLRDTANEAVIDTYLDLAVYAIIAYAIALQEHGESRAH